MRLILLLFILLSFFDPSSYVNASAQQPLSWESPRQGGFVMTLCDDRRGNVWVGCEDTGVQMWDGSRWTQFNSQNGLADDTCYALICDHQGRIWAGTARHGVSVYNGHVWKNYGTLLGPLGNHVIALVCSPQNGDVWGATEAGLFRYSLSQKQWTYFDRSDGLPSQETTCLAFDKKGNLYVGTACDGLAVASSATDYRSWRVVSGHDLASNQINAICVTEDTVFVGTPNGLERSADQGKTWTLLRGKDWLEKAQGALTPQAMISSVTWGQWMLEDDVTCLAADSEGHLLIGHRQAGIEALNLSDGRRIFPVVTSGPPKYDYATAILPRGGLIAVGHYGSGLLNALVGQSKSAMTSFSTDAPTPAPGFPEIASPPSPNDLTAINQAFISSKPAEKTAPSVVALNDDWSTQGNWIDHYGRFAAILCAMGGDGNDLIGGYRASLITYRAWLGRDPSNADYLRYWVHWLPSQNDDSRILQCLALGGRKEAEWDDHGEVIPQSQEGYDVCATLKLPHGKYVLSCYFFNKDGHDTANRDRSFLLRVKPTPISDAKLMKLGSPVGTPGRSADELLNPSPGEAHTRISNFWGGVWKRFMIDLPTDECVTIQLDRDHSFNSILCGVFLDPLGSECGPAGPVW